jgi:cytochrome c oxidase subunit 2
LYAACATCHGIRGEGNAQLFAPSLRSVDDWYLVAQLNNFRNGVRGDDQRDANAAAMRAAALALSDAQAVIDVTAYIVSLK